MPADIIKGASGAPGMVAYPNGLTTGIFNELNFVVPEYKDKLVAKYGNSSYLLVKELLGGAVYKEESTSTATYSHFEKGRSFGVGIVNANVVGITVGANVIFTAKSPDSYNNVAGTQSPYNVGQTVKIRSNGRKGQVLAVDRTTANAFLVTVKPLGNVSFASGTSNVQLTAGDAIEAIGGTQLAGESSLGQLTTQPKMYRYDNTASQFRVGCKQSDLAGMNKSQIDFGDGDFYIGKLAKDNMNLQMIYSMEEGIMEGVPYANTTSIGTIGVLPEVAARGGEADYLTTASYGIDDFQRVTRIIDNNGGAAEYHILQDLNQRQMMNKSLFGLYPNGMVSYGSVGFGSEAAVALGFKSFSTDTTSFHFHRYKGFSAPSQFGYIPNATTGDYRADFGLAAPQGSTRDAKTNETMAFMSVVYQKNPDIPTNQKIYSWGLGYTQGTKTEEASNSFHQIAYAGSRVVAAEQFILIKGVAA
jgi:hypothetical protein